MEEDGFKDETPDIDDFFGGCPECGRNNGFINIGASHWFMCDAHTVKWLRGENLFGCWRFQTEDDWAWGRDYLASYEEVEPVFNITELRQRAEVLKK